MDKRKQVPAFKSEEEERQFWLEHDAAEYFDLAKARFVTFSRLKPTTKSISLRLPETLLNELKVLAHQRDVPYQSLIKMFLAERIAEERRRAP